jgi:hypothetical protein
MSVTFTFGQYVEDPRFGTVLMCGADHTHECTAPDPCEDAALYGSCDHADAAETACGCRRFDVNVSPSNAHLLLERLGYPAGPDDELCGDATPDEILGRALVGNVGQDDNGIPAATEKVPGGPTVIDCGVRAGYFTDRLDAIARLATEAKTRGVLVTWV